MAFHPPPGQRRAGFTLMELMVVIALIAILSAAIVPEMKGSFEDAVLRASARRVVDVCSLANSRAVSLSQTHRVRFDRGSGRLVVEAQPARGVRTAAFQPIRDQGGDSGKVDQRVTLEIRPGESSIEPEDAPADRPTEADTIAFYPDGTADSAEIHLSDRSGATLAMRVNPVTARLRIRERATP